MLVTPVNVRVALGRRDTLISVEFDSKILQASLVGPVKHPLVAVNPFWPVGITTLIMC